VFSNGVVVLAVLAGFLIYTFDANLTRLIQLYVVGVFTAFTLSQTGMVRRWIRLKGQGWLRSAVINAVGAVATGIVLAIVTVTKFQLGARLVVGAIPLIVLFFLAVHHHYERVGTILRAHRLSAKAEARTHVVLLVPDLGLATMDAVGYLRAVRPERVTPLYVGPPELFESTSLEWERKAPRLGRLETVSGADEHPVRAVRSYVRALPREPGDFVTVVIPEEFSGRSWLQFVRRRAELLLKSSLLFEPGVVVTDVPLLPEELAAAQARSERPTEPERNVVLVPVSAVHDATVRAITYAKALHPAAIEGLFFVTEPADAEVIIQGWHDREIDVPLTLVEAPFRDLGDPLLAEIRTYTARGDTVVTVVLPELVPAHWWENILHNQTALYMKRLLLFEPDVVVTSVPFRLREASRASAET
jgi:hypothetical protein